MTQVAAYVALTFLLSWTFWGAAILSGSEAAICRIAGAFGPTMAALILAGIGGREDLRRLLAGFRRWRAPFGLWFFSVLSTAVLGIVALCVDDFLGGTPDWPEPQALALAPVVFLWVLVFSVAGEETGWRGYLMPRLLTRTGPVRASLVLGVVWAVWHLPLWGLPGDFHAAIPIWLFVAQILAVSIIYTWLWLASSGSLVIVHVFHAASNATLSLLPLVPGEGAETLRPLWIAVGLLCLIALVAAVRLASGIRQQARH
ncbi:type II CAAX endopeptidase family protein [Psychromarinibacter sp. C21-152]|uniref:Type II CAAX endopeptidase family protein n=1 Tax=Psychromarinibacter sediminicola TaxID=3033385 RepID=A0AAE3NSW3_9RHOB|nr:type II CAAX endopeptidase family protein [Psychromarinibacter sediminicola]MDF0603678.1 type II CAAX endopeptidase family protein [Psychromarinibacter sediminicola]